MPPDGFLLDMGISPRVAEWLNAHDYIAHHVSRLGLFNASDEQIIAEAVQLNFAIITSDLDFSRLVAASHLSLPTVVTLRLDNPTADEQIKTLSSFLKSAHVPDLSSALVTLDGDRFRIRNLPIQ